MAASASAAETSQNLVEESARGTTGIRKRSALSFCTGCTVSLVQGIATWDETVCVRTTCKAYGLYSQCLSRFDNEISDQ